MAKAVTETCNISTADYKYFIEALNRAIPSSRSKGKLLSFNILCARTVLGARDTVNKVKEDICNRET